MEAQKAKLKKDIEKAINDRMIVMREVVVCASILSRLFRFSNSFPYRKSRDVWRLSNKR